MFSIIHSFSTGFILGFFEIKASIKSKFFDCFEEVSFLFFDRSIGFAFVNCSHCTKESVSFLLNSNGAPRFNISAALGIESSPSLI